MNRMHCPICKKSFDRALAEAQRCYPFCSPRCKSIDLGRWLSEKYQIPAESDATSTGADMTGARLSRSDLPEDAASL